MSQNISVSVTQSLILATLVAYFTVVHVFPDIILVIVLTFSLLKPIFNFQVNTQQKRWPLLNTTLYKDQSMLTLCGLISKGIVSHLHVWSAQVES